MTNTEEPHDVEPDVEAQGLKEVMSVGLAAAALAGAAAPSKAAAADEYERTTAAAIDVKELDPAAEYGLSELEAAGYKVAFEDVYEAGYKSGVGELDAVGYKASLDELDKLGWKQAVETEEGTVWTLTLKWGADEELDVALDRADQAMQYSLGELEKLGFSIDTRELEASGFSVGAAELDELGYKLSWHESVGFKEAFDSSVLGLKLGVDPELDDAVEVARWNFENAWPSK